MKISVFGLGYVGAVTAGCLAEQGHEVVGVDIQPQKVQDFNRGLAPIIEPGLDMVLRQAHRAGRLRATQNYFEAVAGTEVSLVCVGTPSKYSGALDLSHVEAVTGQIREALKRQPKAHTLIYRSTMLPGSTERLATEFLKDLLEQGLEVIYFPEFLREGTAVADFRNPSLPVAGTRNGSAFTAELKPVMGTGTPVVSWATAELLKYACNAFHAAKVAFANEIGRLGKRIGLDGALVMELLCQDTRLNISPCYLRPGNPFGGSCLPKDMRALEDYGRQHGLSLPLLENILVSNEHHLKSLLHIIAERGHSEVVILGLAFKPDTDDLRGSAMVEVAQHLLSNGYSVRIYDPQLNLARIVGRNRQVIDLKMPHLASLLKGSINEALGRTGLIIAAQRCAAISELARWVRPEHAILDINGWPELRDLSVPYEGFCWPQ